MYEDSSILRNDARRPLIAFSSWLDATRDDVFHCGTNGREEDVLREIATRNPNCVIVISSFLRVLKEI